MPLRVNGAVIGVVGIFGDPPEVENLAKLVEAYVTKSYQLEAMMIPRLAEGEMRSRLLHDLLIGDERSLSHAQVLLESLRLEKDILHLPKLKEAVKKDSEDAYKHGCPAGAGPTGGAKRRTAALFFGQRL